MKGMLVIAALITFALVSCDEDPGSTIVGPGNDTQINGVTFTVDTTYLDASGSGRLVARGLATTTVNIVAPWYVEGQFYSDSTMTIKLGGNNIEIHVPLKPGQSTYWTIYFYTSAVDVKQFPDFRIGDLRAIYRN